MLKTVQKLLNTTEHQKTEGKSRSPHWQKTKNEHLEKKPSCAACGGVIGVQVHHIIPFSVDSSKELEPTNLISLCENGNKNINCHISVGHLMSFKDNNPDVVKDAAYVLAMIDRSKKRSQD